MFAHPLGASFHVLGVLGLGRDARETNVVTKLLNKSLLVMLQIGEHLIHARELNTTGSSHQDTTGASRRNFHLLTPSVIFPHLNHRRENVVPGFLLRHDGVWKHATVPTDVFKLLCGLPMVVAHPVSRIARDVQLPVGIIHTAMAARLVVSAGAMHRRVVLRDMKIDHPWTERLGHLLHRIVESFPFSMGFLWPDSIFRSV